MPQAYPTPILHAGSISSEYLDTTGKVWQWCQRSQAQHLAAPAQRLEALDETLLPRRVPLGWAVIVRPDRCVMAEGPVANVATLLECSLARIARTSNPEAVHDTTWNAWSVSDAA